MTDEEIRRRLRAARALAGLTVEQLAERTGSGLGAKTLYNVESGKRELRPMERREIARACGLPVDFFYVPFEALEGVMERWPDRETMRLLGLEDKDVLDQALSLYRGLIEGSLERLERDRGRPISDPIPGGAATMVTEIAEMVRTLRLERDEIDKIRNDARSQLEEMRGLLAEAEAFNRRAAGRAEAAEAAEEAAQRTQQTRGRSASGSGRRRQGGREA